MEDACFLLELESQVSCIKLLLLDRGHYVNDAIMNCSAGLSLSRSSFKFEDSRCVYPLPALRLHLFTIVIMVETAMRALTALLI